MSAAWWARAGCLVAVALSLAAVPTADAAPLRLDAGFGESGIARVPFRLAQSYSDLRVLRPVRQPDGKVLVAAASAFDHGNSQILIARFTRRGRPDTTFGHGGWEHLGLRWNFAPQAVEVRPDGRILVLGAAGYGPFMYPAPGQFGLARLLPDGSRDRTFGMNGFVTWNPPWRTDTHTLYALPGVFVPQGGGRLLAAGVVYERRWPGAPYVSLSVEVPPRVVFVRFKSDGSVDESFGRAGLIEGPDGPDFFSAWAALPDGRTVALSARNEGSDESWWLHRFTADGAVDSTFGTNGSVRLESAYVGELVPARDGGVVFVLGTELRRILPSGQLDAHFGTACGRPPLADGNPGGFAAATPDGGVLATGGTYLDPMRFALPVSFVMRYGADGCAAARPLLLGSLSVGPPLLRGRRIALVGASYGRPDGFARGLALIRIRR
jgi:uncharacterized delta-60 repeat protein